MDVRNVDFEDEAPDKVSDKVPDKSGAPAGSAEADKRIDMEKVVMRMQHRYGDVMQALAKPPSPASGWTTEKPTEPGFYWGISKISGAKRIYEVFHSGEVLGIESMGRSWDEYIESYWPVKLEPPA